MKKSWKLLPFIGALVLLALSALGGVASAAPSAKEVQAQAVDFAFEPKTLTISAGDTVVWTNTGKVAHTVTASDGSWDSGRLEPGQTFSHTFDNPGDVAYYCKPHGKPDGTGMAGTVMVQAASTGAPAPAPAAQAPAPAAQASPTAAAQPTGPTPMVEASDQAVVGGSVTVARVVAAQDGWIVIHTNTADNKPGPVIGHSPVKAGENSNVKVALSQTPQVGDRLWPMLHIDAGQIGTYEFPGADTPVTANGDVVMVQISVTGGTASAQAPRALPNTGSADSTPIWMFGAVAAIMLIAGATLIRYGSGRPR